MMWAVLLMGSLFAAQDTASLTEAMMGVRTRQPKPKEEAHAVP